MRTLTWLLGGILCGGGLAAFGERESKPEAAAAQALKIDPELKELSLKDIRTISRDALRRFAGEYALSRRFFLANHGIVDLYSDRPDQPGKLDLDMSRGPLEPSIQEVFGDYNSLPESVRAVVSEKRDPAATGKAPQLPLSLTQVACSREQRMVQVSLAWHMTICESFTFLYRVQKDGRLVFLRSRMMGCSYPIGFIPEKSSED